MGQGGLGLVFRADGLGFRVHGVGLGRGGNPTSTAESPTARVLGFERRHPWSLQRYIYCFRTFKCAKVRASVCRFASAISSCSLFHEDHSVDATAVTADPQALESRILLSMIKVMMMMMVMTMMVMMLMLMLAVMVVIMMQAKTMMKIYGVIQRDDRVGRAECKTRKKRRRA